MKKKVLEELFYDEPSYENWLKSTLSVGCLPYDIPFKRFDIEVKEKKHKELIFYTLAPKNHRQICLGDEPLIIYFHGGAYLSQPSIGHWHFLNSLVRDTGIKAILPLYPKLPFFDALYSVNTVLDFYISLTNSGHFSNNIIFMGDSSGGGFLLSMLLKMQKQVITKPSQLIMFSPWLDVSMTNAQIKRIEANDNFLSAFVLKKLGDLWRNIIHEKDPLVSPLYGSPNYNGPVSIFTGTFDILHPDSEAFYVKNKSKLNINYIKREGQMHAYNILTASGFKLEYDNIIKLITNRGILC